MRSLLEYAQWYVELGLAVLPLTWPVQSENGLACSCRKSDCGSPAKHPFARLVANGLKDATKDLAVVERWFGNRDLNIGIVTGAVSGIIVLDIDPRHGGDETLANLERQHGPLPRTWRFLTGGGGEHIVLKHPGGRMPNSAGKLGSGIDVRGDGGYIVAPPSQHISGRAYAISVDHHPDEAELAQAPEWLIAGLKSRNARKKPAPKLPEEWRGMVGGTVAEGTRNRTIASLAGHLLRNRINPWVTLDLLQAWNRTRCDPPLADAEVVATVRSIARREIERREGRDAR